MQTETRFECNVLNKYLVTRKLGKKDKRRDMTPVGELRMLRLEFGSLGVLEMWQNTLITIVTYTSPWTKQKLLQIFLKRFFPN